MLFNATYSSSGVMGVRSRLEGLRHEADAASRRNPPEPNPKMHRRSFALEETLPKATRRARKRVRAQASARGVPPSRLLLRLGRVSKY